MKYKMERTQSFHMCPDPDQFLADWTGMNNICRQSRLLALDPAPTPVCHMWQQRSRANAETWNNMTYDNYCQDIISH